MLALHSEYIHCLIEKNLQQDKIEKFGKLKNPEPKSINRMQVKVQTDYKEEQNPIGMLRDTVRRSLECENLNSQQKFLDFLADESSWQPLRQKNTLLDENSSVKQCLVNYLFMPTRTTGFFTKKKVKVTFANMMKSKKFKQAAKQVKKRNNIANDTYDAAVKLLKNRTLETQNIDMIVEIQLYLNHFLEKRRMCHIWYKIVRSSGCKALTLDCAKYATNATMAYQAPPREIQIFYKNHKINETDKNWNIHTTKLDINLLGNAISRSNYVERIDLSNSALGDNGVKVVANAMEKNNTITIIILNNNNIGDKGAVAIGDMLEKTNKLLELHMANNNVGDVGARAIASPLEENRTLTMINLDNNKIGEEGAKSIAGGLEKNTKVTTMSVASNNIGEESIKTIETALQKNDADDLTRFIPLF
eukprot:m.47232 g.47232  ORF g.47232 m.47232 type:complete len:418 (-) comp10468_c0_seq1:101-1354(-)